MTTLVIITEEFQEWLKTCKKCLKVLEAWVTDRLLNEWMNLAWWLKINAAPIEIVMINLSFLEFKVRQKRSSGKTFRIWKQSERRLCKFAIMVDFEFSNDRYNWTVDTGKDHDGKSVSHILRNTKITPLLADKAEMSRKYRLKNQIKFTTTLIFIGLKIETWHDWRTFEKNCGMQEFTLAWEKEN